MTNPRHSRGALLVILVIWAAACRQAQKADETPPVAEALGPRAVTGAEVVLADFRPLIQATGTLVPERQADVRALVDGRIEKLPVDIGTRVQKGRLLFEVRTVEYRNTLQEAEANVARATALLADATRETQRMQGLFAEGSATEQMRDRAIAAHEQAEAGLRQAEAARDTARQALDDCTIVSPWDGVVTARYRREGEFVGRGDPMVQVMDLSVLDAEMEIPERYAGAIAEGLEVSMTVRAGNLPVTGRVVAVNPKVETASRTFRVKVEVDNRDGRLQAGLFVSAVFRLPVQAAQPSVPAAALSRDEGRSRVWIVREGKAFPAEVVEGVVQDGRVQIVQGLAAGEVVIVEGAGGLVEGNPVTVSR